MDEVRQNYTKGDWRLRFGRTDDFVDKLLYNMNYWMFFMTLYIILQFCCLNCINSVTYF